jgi:uncharacterized protein (TIGR04255 family)
VQGWQAKECAVQVVRLTPFQLDNSVALPVAGQYHTAMETETSYPKAPITEAIIDLQVVLPEGLSAQNLSPFFDLVTSLYPHKQTLNRLVGQLEFAVPGSASATSTATEIGLMLRSADGKQVVQVHTSGFTFSRLAPYERWSSVRDEARRLWDLYRNIAKPTKVSRLALRYINRIDIPLPIRDFKDYLNTLPELSPTMPQGLAGFFMQLTVPLQDLRATLIVNEAMVPPPGPEVVSVALDIDVFRLDALPADEDGVWALFEELRAKKNQIFEACITDQARRLFS